VTAKLIEQNFRPVAVKSLYNYLRSTVTDDTMYAGVLFPDREDYEQYAGTQDSESELFGPTANDSDFDLADSTFYSQNMYSMHKLFRGGASRVVKRIDWEPNTIYQAYPAQDSYVMSKNFVSGVEKLNVFQCIFSPLTPSIYAPTDFSLSPIKTPDGYVWKYLFTITSAEAVRFLTNDWMPVPEKVVRSEVQNLTPDATRYTQFLVQENSEIGTIYNTVIDKEAVLADSDLVFENNVPVTLTVIDESLNVPEQRHVIELIWNEDTDNITLNLVQEGKGYVGPVTVVPVDDEEKVVEGATAIIAPGEGHGADAPEELRAYSIMLSARIIPNEETIKLMNSNTANMITLIRNPIDDVSKRIATQDFYVTCKSFTTETAPTYTINEEIISTVDDNKIGRVINVNGDRVYYINYKENEEGTSFIDSETITNVNYSEEEPDVPIKGQKVHRIKKIYDREVVFNSGDIVMVDWKPRTIIRSPDQIESLNFIFNL